MALMTVNSEDMGDFRSKARWSAGKKLDVVLRLPRTSHRTRREAFSEATAQVAA